MLRTRLLCCINCAQENCSVDHQQKQQILVSLRCCMIFGRITLKRKWRVLTCWVPSLWRRLCQMAEPIEPPFGTASGMYPINHVLDGRANWRHLANMVEWLAAAMSGSASLVAVSPISKLLWTTFFCFDMKSVKRWLFSCVHIGHLIYLISFQLISFYLDWVRMWSDAVCRGCKQSNKAVRPTLFWLVTAMTNCIGFHSALSSDEMRWDEMSDMYRVAQNKIRPLIAYCLVGYFILSHPVHTFNFAVVMQFTLMYTTPTAAVIYTFVVICFLFTWRVLELRKLLCDCNS